MWFAAIIAVSILLLVVMIISPVTVEIKYTYYKLNASQPGTPHEYVPDRGVRFSLLWGLVSLRMKLSYFELTRRAFHPVLKIGTTFSKHSSHSQSQEKTRLTAGRALAMCRLALKIYRATRPASRYLLAKTKLRHFKWSTMLGLPEAGQTGMATGLLWVIKSNAVSHLYRALNRPAPRPELAVMPVFNDRALQVHFDCIFSLRSGHIIYTGLLAGWYYLLNRRKFNV